MDPISSDKWKKIEALLDQALDLPAAQRTMFLEEASQDDTALRKILMELWEAGGEADTFLEGNVPADVAQVIQQLSTEDAYGPIPTKGTRFGEYELVEEVGRGGMSVVYKAVRADGQFDHTVALKILKRGMDTDQLVRRFMAERQILAGLQHANIARLLDGGATEDGRPYLIMEFVQGVPITDYCDQAKLNINRRLELFKKVAEAVAFAHRNLIVHRDLKPSNILVTNDGEVKLLDFGIAKVLSEDIDETVLALTMQGGRVMTPEYAAPEQIFGESITTATDVYAMGVLLYELLCGQLPIRFEIRQFPAIEKAMRTHKVSLPSASLRQKSQVDNSTIEDIASARSTTGVMLTQHVEGDLDMIVQMALRKEPERRYPSMAALIDEVDRYQAGLPVKARPDTLGYRMRKFYGRYKAGVLSASLAIILLIASLIGTLMQAQVAREQSRVASEERDIAQREAVKSARITEFLVDVFESTDPDNALGDTLSAYDILERGAQRIEGELGGEPALQSEMMAVFGRMYQRMGAYDKAESWVEQAQTRRAASGSSSGTTTLQDNTLLASVLQDQGRYTEAESLLVDVLGYSYDLTEETVITAYAQAQDRLGTVFSDLGKYDEAKAIYLEALNSLIAVHGEGHLNTAPVYTHMGDVVGLLSEFELAQTYFGQALAIYRDYPDGNVDNLAGVLHSLSEVLRNKGEFEEAEQLGKEGLEIREQLFGKAHPLVVQGMNQVGNVLTEMGKNTEAEAIYLEALDIQRNALGEKHPFTIELLGNLGGNYIRMGDLKQAVVQLKEALVLREEVLGKDHPTIAIALSNLGVALGSLGNYEEAEVIHRRSLVLAKRHFGERHPGVASCASNLANVLYKLERYEEALPYADLAIDIDSEKLDANHRFVAVSMSIKGQILFEMGRIAEGQEFLEEAIAVFAKSSLPEDHHTRVRPQIALGKLHLSQGRLDEAAPLLEASLRIRQKAFETDDWRIGEAEVALGMYHLARGEKARAKSLLSLGRGRLAEGLGEQNRLTREADRYLAQL
ncbi:MAG: serine/threonine-protein kinase [Bacteroidota bacterium]